MNVFDNDGSQMDAHFSIESEGGQVSLVFESRGGTRGTPSARNVDYHSALAVLLARMGSLGLVLTNAVVDSRTTTHLTANERRLKLRDHGPYPVQLAHVAAPERLRVDLSQAQAEVGRAPGATGSGNGVKRIRLFLSGSIDSNTLASNLAYGLSGPSLLLDLLSDENDEIRPDAVKLHLATTPSGEGKGPLDAYFIGEFGEWQSRQSKRNFDRPYIVSLISLQDDRWLYVGVFRRVGLHQGPDEYRWKYDTEPVTSGLAGRVVVRWRREGRQSYRLAETLASNLPVVEVFDEPLTAVSWASISARPGVLPRPRAGEVEGSVRRISAANTTQSERVAVEAHNSATFERTGSGPTTAERRESDLVKRFEHHLRLEGRMVARYRLRAKGQVCWMYTDTYIVADYELVEAKSSASRAAVREAIGQLFDYRRLLAPTPRQLTVLLPNKPVDDLLDLLVGIGVSCVWEESPGEFSRRSSDGHAAIKAPE